MDSSSRIPERNQLKPQPSEAGSRRMASSVRDSLVHPDAAPQQEMPLDEKVEATFSRVENLLGQGRYGSAVAEITKLETEHSPLAAQYAFLRAEKLSRAQLGIADRYFLAGDTAKAREYYRHVLGGAAGGPAGEIAGIGERAFDTLMKQRSGQMTSLLECIRTGSMDQWCGVRKGLNEGTVLDLQDIRQRIAPDFDLQKIFGSRPPFRTVPGYLDSVPPESEAFDIPSSIPGSVFRGRGGSASEGAASPPDDRIPASLALPLLANVMAAKARLFAIDQGLTLTGQVKGTLPLFRYEYLRDRAKQTISLVRGIESRMYPIQFELDDFAEIVDAVHRPLAEQKAELEALNQRIRGLTTQLADLAQAKLAVDNLIIALEPMQDQCDCDWWCWTMLILIDAAMVTAFVLTFIAAIGTGSVALALIYVVAGTLGVELAAFATVTVINCENIGYIERSMKTVQKGLQQAIDENRSELTHALATRDILISHINALENELSAIYQSNAARVLDAKTLDLIQAQYNSIRQSLMTRAQTIAAQAQEAFNFERDMDVDLIRQSYADHDRKEYATAESLLRDLDGLDYVDLTGRTQKAMQLSQTVSLRKHYPASFLALRASGGSRFTTSLSDFDRWFPGTYLQRIKEIRVEVVADWETVPVRGYLSNDGVSIVRFLDTGNSRPVDGVNVFAEPDADLAKLCYKRLQRRRHVDTMAFPEFASPLYNDRMALLQDRERNYFENIGLESTWIIQFLPDQPIDLSKVTDVLIHFQYEALFDENLRAVQEKKRYAGRKESTALPIGQLLMEQGTTVDFSGTVSFAVPASRLEAPGIEKRIVNVGFVIKPKNQARLEGAAELDISYDGSPRIHLVTNDSGVLATAPNLPVGNGLQELETLAHGKSIDKIWTVGITALPGGLTSGDIEEMYLLLNYEYVTGQ